MATPESCATCFDILIAPLLDCLRRLRHGRLLEGWDMRKIHIRTGSTYNRFDDHRRGRKWAQEMLIVAIFVTFDCKELRSGKK